MRIVLAVRGKRGLDLPPKNKHTGRKDRHLTAVLVLLLTLTFSVYGCSPLDQFLDSTSDPAPHQENQETAPLQDTEEQSGEKTSTSSTRWEPAAGFGGNEEIRRHTIEVIEGSSNRKEAMERVYDWVTHHISYDMEKYRRVEGGEGYHPDAGKTLQSRKGVCGHYAELTLQMLLSVGIEASYEKGEILNRHGRYEKHAWNKATIDGTTYALDTTWGAGFRNEAGEFVRMPTRLYLTSPEELRKMQQDETYHREKRKEMMVSKARDASAEHLSSYEEKIAGQLNLPQSLKLRQEARRQAEHIGKKTLENWKEVYVYYQGMEQEWINLNEIYDRLDDTNIRRLEASIFTSWGYPPSTNKIAEEISSGVNLGNFNEVGVGVIRQDELIVTWVLFVSH